MGKLMTEPLQLKDHPDRCPSIYLNQLQCARKRHDDNKHWFDGISWTDEHESARVESNFSYKMVDGEWAAVVVTTDQGVTASITLALPWLLGAVANVAVLERQSPQAMGAAIQELMKNG